jgi:hypothetical protein
MKPLDLMIVSLLICFALISCKSPQKIAEQAMPAAEGETFWTYITKTKPYSSWSFWPGKEGIYPGQSPHGEYLKLYANDIAINAAKAGMKTMPNGVILVKENYGKDQTTLMAITPMYKFKGYNPEAGDWFWGKYGPDGKVMAAGKVNGCIQCHEDVKDNDWIFTKVQ